MNNKEYLSTLLEFIDERLYITTSVDEINKEIERNCWWITGSKEEINSLSLENWKSFFQDLIKDRQTQLDNSKININLIFYCWYDELAGQIRFNLVNSNHPKLSFSCEYKFVKIEKIISYFKNDSSPGMIPNEELNEVIIDEPLDQGAEVILDVYKEVIYKTVGNSM